MYTAVLARRPEKYEIIAVEPHEEMREELENKGLKRVESQEGDANAMGVAEEWGDALIAAQVSLSRAR